MKSASVTISTKEHLLRTAERLFATRGIESVSLRQIAREGGQRNVGAMQYHFGDRRGLFEAILEYRMLSVDSIRREMLREVDAAGLGEDSRELTKCLVIPYMQHIYREGGTSHYVEFLARFQACHPEHLKEIHHDKRWQRCVLEVTERLIELMADVPQSLRMQRMMSAGTNMVQAAAEFERSLRQKDVSIDGLPLFTANLVDALTGLLMAPASDETRELLEKP